MFNHRHQAFHLLAYLAVGIGFCQCSHTYKAESGITARIRNITRHNGILSWDRANIMAIDGKPVGMKLADKSYRRIDAGKRELVVQYQGGRDIFALLNSHAVPI